MGNYAINDLPPTRVALIGTGGWAGHHARIFAGRRDVDFCAICGRDPVRTGARASQHGARPYTDLDRMLREEKPDLVSVCLPNLHHFDATRKVIASGIPLFVEKPLVFDLDEADLLLDEAERRGLFFAINFNHRYARPVQFAREALVKGRLGKVVFAVWRFGGEGGSVHHPWANLIETQCHGFDLLEYLLGPVVSVSGDSFENEGHSTVSLSLKFTSGAVGGFLGTYDSSYAYRNAQRLEINGTKGRVLIEDNVRRFSFQEVGSERAEVWEAGFFNDEEREFRRTFDWHVDDMLAAFRRGAPPPVAAESGRRALQLARCAGRAILEGRRVMVPRPK